MALNRGLYSNAFVDWIVGFWNTYWKEIVIFLCVLVFGIVLIKIILAVINKMFSRSKFITPTANHFLLSLIKALLYIIWLIALLSLLGVPTTSMIALLSAFALALSLALQSTISNLASGVVLVFTKPFSEGDYIDIQGGPSGTVERISMFNTRLLTPNNQVVVVPNNTVVSSGITNYSIMPTRRLDITLSVAYGTDVDKVKETVLGVARAHEKVLADPEPTVRLNEHAASSLDFTLRVWVDKSDYWAVYFDLKEQMLAAFVAGGIEVPFSQVDVHVKND